LSFPTSINRTDPPSIVSKMDSNMLTIAPILMQPVELMKSTLRMFNPELESFGFNTELVLEQTYKEHSVDWVYCDPSRLSQVLVNLLTNGKSRGAGPKLDRLSLILSQPLNSPKPRITAGSASGSACPPALRPPNLQWLTSNGSLLINKGTAPRIPRSLAMRSFSYFPCKTRVRAYPTRKWPACSTVTSKLMRRLTSSMEAAVWACIFPGN